MKIYILTKAVSECKRKWASKEKVDERVLNEWEQTVIECIKITQSKAYK